MALLPVISWVYTSCETDMVDDTHSMLHSPVVNSQLLFVPERVARIVTVDRN